jgi:hypothetical protein
MSLNELWEKAVRKTEIVRPRVLPLNTGESTRLPYLCLSESSINRGDTAVRRGEIVVEKPSIILPYNAPQFAGFDFEKTIPVSEELFKSFLLVRGVQFPGMRYNNRSHSIDVHEGSLSKAVEYYKKELQKTENVNTGLIVSPDDCWQFSVLLFVCSLVVRSAEGDIRRLMDDMRRFDRS